ncbi:MAG: protein translocase subunit SecF [Minisyncoccia bacterium]
MFIVKNRKIFYTISITLITLSFVAMTVWGLVLGIDFKGGSVMEFTYANGRPDIETVRTSLNALPFGDTIKDLRSIGDNGYFIKLRSVTDKERVALQEAVNVSTYKADITKFNSIGPVLGKEAAQKAIISIILVLICIITFITFAFRKVSEPVQSWKYGVFAVVALSHDIIIPIGIFSILGHYFGYEVDTLFVTAMLVILGFSIHDTIVVYDRIRENLKINRGLGKASKPFDEVVGMSISQTFVRSINTSVSVILAVLALYFFGPTSTQTFSLVLIIGVFFGTYSSIFIASNLLVTIQKLVEKKA